MGKESLLSKIFLLMAVPALRQLRGKIDPRNYNGAMFVGLGGVCVKSHGSMDQKGFANAIKVAANLVTHRFNETVAAELQSHKQNFIASTEQAPEQMEEVA
ncbi:MAG: plsX, partial [Alphaproteobacteria bacterium]|nr:plsX [Alphaproteobacteria bacterium]